MVNTEKQSSPSSAPSSSGRKPISKVAKTYLIAYNLVQTIGWTFLAHQVVNYYMKRPSDGATVDLYDTVKCTLIIFQNAAILEVLHAAIRIVPSSPSLTAMQIASRVMVVCGVLISTVAARSSVGFVMCLVTWSITEIIRYANYTLNLLGYVPYFVTWLRNLNQYLLYRYSTFIILYPLGITGELLCTYAAKNEVAETGIYSITMPNRLNFIFSYETFLIVYMLLYIPIFPMLYMHMVNQRKKVLGGKDKTVKKSH